MTCPTPMTDNACPQPRASAQVVPGAPPFPRGHGRCGGGAACSRSASGSTRSRPRRCRPQALRPPGALAEDRLPRRLRALRPVRARLPLRHARAGRTGRRRGHRHAVLRRRATCPARCATTSPASRPARPARSTTALTDIDEASMGAGGADRPGELPQLPGPALRRLLPRLPGDRQGDHARAACTTRAPIATRCCMPTVHSEHCTGCGKCEKSCVLPEAAIKVLPRKLAQGEAASTTARAGREGSAGGSLIGEQQQLPMRGLEGASTATTAWHPAMCRRRCNLRPERSRLGMEALSAAQPSDAVPPRSVTGAARAGAVARPGATPSRKRAGCARTSG